MEASIVNAYFPDLIFQKVEIKDQVTIYAACISGDLGGGGKNYALALVPNHLALVGKSRLVDLLWICFQTRNLKGYKLPLQKWTLPSSGVQNIMFHLTSRGVGSSDYMAENGLPFEMTLLHNPKNKSKYQYHERMNLVASLATFQCSIMFLRPEEPSLLPARKSEVPSGSYGYPETPESEPEGTFLEGSGHRVMNLDYSEIQEPTKSGRAALKGYEAAAPRTSGYPSRTSPSSMETRISARTPQDVVSSRRRVDSASSTHQSKFGVREPTEDGFGRTPSSSSRAAVGEGFELV